ncbi:hypothetical protein GW846_01515 [Candidatus Gracilibacteria bacterium]|nr:hypothetical protein [Candidatus Gracilibacteria bacterium]
MNNLNEKGILRAPESVKNATIEELMSLIRGQQDALFTGIYMDEETVERKQERFDMLSNELNERQTNNI